VSVPLLNTCVPGAKGYALARPESVQFSASEIDTGWKLAGMQFIGAARRYTLQHESGQVMTSLRPNNHQFKEINAFAGVSVDYSAMYFIANR
jgi:hypothetical protein